MTRQRRHNFPSSLGWLAGLALLSVAVNGAEPLPAGVTPTAAPEWSSAAPGYAWSFPRDHYAHPGYKTEWWYLTGHLQPLDEPGAETVSFQFTIFRVGLSPTVAEPAGSAWAANALVMGHAAVTDPATGRHVFSETLWRAAAGLGGFGAPGDSLLAWCLAPPGTDAVWSIGLSPAGFAVCARDDRLGLDFALDCAPLGPVVFHGEGGFSPKNADGSAGSLYYSHPRLGVTGSLRRDGRQVAVAGQAWLDREVFTSTLGPQQKGWDWVSLQLDDGRDLMLYRMRGADDRVDFALGTLMSGDSAPVPLPAGTWTLEPLAVWTSPATGAAYPVRWRLQVPAEAIDVALEAVLSAQENVSARTGVHYWEGAVRVRPFSAQTTGAGGRGFVELTGYGPGSKPPV